MSNKLLELINKSIENQSDKSEFEDTNIDKKEFLKGRKSFNEKTDTGAQNLVNFIFNNSSHLIDLNAKVKIFLDWYYENIVDHNFQKREKMKNFIEKMAVWYELRYPDVDEILFNNNHRDLCNDDWHNDFNIDKFIELLSTEERRYLANPKYASIVYLNPNSRGAYLHLDKDGNVVIADDITRYTNSVIKDEELEGLSIRKVIELFKEKGITIPENNELDLTIKRFDTLTTQKEQMLNCIMYRIIERGGSRIGPRRAFLFALEFKRDIDVPMMYAIDRTDPKLRLFINEYIKAGGFKDLECYIDYFSKKYQNDKLEKISIQELILTQANNAATFYTPEEYVLHQELVSALSHYAKKKVKK